MPRRATDLFDQIVGFQPLLAAARRAALGKRRKSGCAVFLAGLEREVLRLDCESAWTSDPSISNEIKSLGLRSAPKPRADLQRKPFQSVPRAIDEHMFPPMNGKRR